MSLKKTNIVRNVVGTKDRLVKEQIVNYYQSVFEEQNLVGLEGKEEEKTEYYLKILDFIESSGNSLVAGLGIGPIAASHRNIHILSREIGPEDRQGDGLYQGGAFQQFLMACFIPRTRSSVRLAVRVFHELMHLKSYHAVRFVGIVDNELRVNVYRIGLMTESVRKAETVYFLGLNEAITTEMTMRFYRQCVKQSDLFKEEAVRTDALISGYINSGIKKIRLNNNYFPFDDVYYLNKISDRLDVDIFGYEKERKILNDVLDIIFKRHRDRFSEREKVFNIFAKAMFDGNMLPAARLVESAFGKGAFRALGEGLNIV